VSDPTRADAGLQSADADVFALAGRPQVEDVVAIDDLTERFGHHVSR
jgi:hypothetical protein